MDFVYPKYLPLERSCKETQQTGVCYIGFSLYAVMPKRILLQRACGVVLVVQTTQSACSVGKNYENQTQDMAPTGQRNKRQF
jgi:hypothetical protein